MTSLDNHSQVIRYSRIWLILTVNHNFRKVITRNFYKFVLNRNFRTDRSFLGYCTFYFFLSRCINKLNCVLSNIWRILNSNNYIIVSSARNITFNVRCTIVCFVVNRNRIRDQIAYIIIATFYNSCNIRLLE